MCIPGLLALATLVNPTPPLPYASSAMLLPALEVHDMGKPVGDAKTNQWLQCHEIKQASSGAFEAVDPAVSWMPFSIQQYFLEELEGDEAKM